MLTIRSVVRPLLVSLAVAPIAVPLAAQSLELQALTAPLERPVEIAHTGDAADGRLFLVLQPGLVRILDEDRQLVDEPFLDLRDRVLFDAGSPAGEQGLLGLAFHPAHAENGYVFAYYNDLDGDTVVSRFAVDPTSGTADPSTEVMLLEVDQPGAAHNGGKLAFGPLDGHLYVALGDGSHGSEPACPSQDGDSLLGKILRLDVDTGAAAPPHYAIPEDNPYLGDPTVRDEVWALGLRNPWKLSFDRETGDLYVADVGHTDREEVNVERVGDPGGHNYGWNLLEGTLCRGTPDLCGGDVPACESPLYTPPAGEYQHGQSRCSVTGGFRYRGSLVPELRGLYLFGDYCGQLFVADPDEEPWTIHPVTPRLPFLVTFGEDSQGELYLVSTRTVYAVTGFDPGPLATTCEPAPDRLCLQDGRFTVELGWTATSADPEPATAVQLTDETGYFWFENDENIEVVVKVLRACGPPYDRFWVFAAGLTNLGVEMVVTDLQADEDKTYANDLGVPFAPIQDTDAFDTCP